MGKKFKSLFSIFKENSALTIVEVLVSVVVMMLVVMYGMVFFASAFRLSIESREYMYILQNVVNNLEEAISQSYGTALNNNSYLVKEEYLRGKWKVDYVLEFSNILVPHGVSSLVYARYITSRAHWQYENAGNTDWQKKNQISVKTIVSFSNNDIYEVDHVKSRYGRWRD